MIYLQPELVSTMSEVDFWTWFKRTFPSQFELPEQIGSDDAVLQYAVLGPPKTAGGRWFSLCWELYPEMIAKKLHAPGDVEKVALMIGCHGACERSFVSTAFSQKFFPGADIMPVGIDTELFRWRGHKRSGAFWCGTEHPMKGLQAAKDWAAAHDMPLTVVMKGSMAQTDLAELMARHEYVLLSGLLTPLYLVEWEALACGLKPVNVSGVEREFDIDEVAYDPRGFVFDQGWSRFQVEQAWRRVLAD